MSNKLFMVLTLNAAILLVFGIVYDLAVKKTHTKFCEKIIYGLMMSLIGVLLMTIPWSFLHGVNIDARSILLSVSGLFLGPLSTGIAVLVLSLYRIMIGGPGVFAGLGIIISSAFTGIYFHYKFFSGDRPVRLWHLLIMGYIAHIFMLAMVFFLPINMALEILKQILIPVLTIYPFATMLLGYLMLNNLRRTKLEKALQDSEEHYRELFVQAPVPYQSLDREGFLVNVNEAWLESLGYTREEVIGKNLSVFLHPSQRERFVREFKQFVIDEKEPNAEFQMLKRNGDYIEAAFNGRIVKDKSGKFLHTLCVFEDITERRLTEKALSENANSLKKLFENAPMGIFRSTKLGRVYHVNQGFAKIIGAESAQEAFEYISAKDTGFFADNIKRDEMIKALETDGRVEGFEIEVLRMDGTRTWVLLNAAIGDRLASEDYFFDGFCIDIGNMKAANQKIAYTEAIMRGLFEYMSSGSGIYEVVGKGNSGSDYIVRFFNREALLHEKKELHQIIGKSLKDLRPNIDEFGLIPLLSKVYKTGKPQYMPPTLYVDENFNHWYENWIFKLPTGEVVTLYNDVTDMVKYRTQLENSKIELEKTVEERTKQLQEINNELEVFTHAIAHDLRAPLRSISGLVSVLQEENEATWDSETQGMMAMINKNILKLDKQIVDLLSVLKLSRQDLKLQDVDMSMLIKDCIDELIDAREADKYLVKIHPLRGAICDPILIRHVWMNLLSNAVKYTSHLEERVIEIGSSTNADGCVYYVKDNGIGFDEKHSENLFGLFRRLHNEYEFEGNGVGLAIVQRLIAKHKGKVWATGKLHEGAEFYFSLPAEST